MDRVENLVDRDSFLLRYDSPDKLIFNAETEKSCFLVVNNNYHFKSMKLGAIVQARMGSMRYSGKVLYKVYGRPMLQYLLERLDHCSLLDSIVVATSLDDIDIPIAEFCKQYGVICYRGALLNVAARFKEVLERYQFNAFVRVNGDSPLLDTSLIEKGINIFIDGNYDLVTNILQRTYPIGQSVEVLRTDTFCSAYQLMNKEDDLEHVTSFFYRYPDRYRIYNFTSGSDYSGIQLAVDTEDDMQIFMKIVSKMERPHWEYGLQDILNIYESL